MKVKDIRLFHNQIQNSNLPDDLKQNLSELLQDTLKQPDDTSLDKPTDSKHPEIQPFLQRHLRQFLNQIPNEVAQNNPLVMQKDNLLAYLADQPNLTQILYKLNHTTSTQNRYFLKNQLTTEINNHIWKYMKEHLGASLPLPDDFKKSFYITGIIRLHLTWQNRIFSIVNPCRIHVLTGKITPSMSHWNICPYPQAERSTDQLVLTDFTLLLPDHTSYQTFPVFLQEQKEKPEEPTFFWCSRHPFLSTNVDAYPQIRIHANGIPLFCIAENHPDIGTFRANLEQMLMLTAKRYEPIVYSIDHPSLSQVSVTWKTEDAETELAAYHVDTQKQTVSLTTPLLRPDDPSIYRDNIWINHSPVCPSILLLPEVE